MSVSGSFILLVEDHEMNRDMLKRRLERRGFRVEVAVDGAQAVEWVETSEPDLILMDMSLPVMDGWTATTQIKAMPTKQHIPIIGLTAHAMSGDRERCIAAGCNEYEIKPVDFNRLLEKINLLLPVS